MAVRAAVAVLVHQLDSLEMLVDILQQRVLLVVITRTLGMLTLVLVVAVLAAMAQIRSRLVKAVTVASGRFLTTLSTSLLGFLQQVQVRVAALRAAAVVEALAAPLVRVAQAAAATVAARQQPLQHKME
jgi:hypothetical protein